MLAVEVTHTGARDKPYRNTFQAIPANRRFRLPLDEAHWPKIPGTLSARVTSPDQYEYAHLTQSGYYVVRFDLDFDPWNPGGESAPLRLAKPFAGKLQTGMHFPALDGDEAVIAFRDGDPNKPYIAAFHHHSQATDLITNQDRWMSRNVIRTQSDNKLEMEDWKGQEHIKLSTEHSGKSQLSLGHMVNGQREQRGQGFELRTDAQGAVRAGAGLLLAADSQQRANGMQSDTTAGVQQAESVLNDLQALMDAAAQSQAEIAQLKSENAWLRNSVSELKASVLQLSAPDGIGASTPNRVSVTAGQDIGLSSKANIHFSALKNIVVAATNVVSLFAAQLGVKIFAAKGKVALQAQSGDMELIAHQGVTIASASDSITVSGNTKLVLTCGGATLTLANGNVRVTCPGEFRVDAASYFFDGPQTVRTPLPILPRSEFNPNDHRPMSN
jgi:type VI secretion system secreted protein VgrG